jgi:vitellogenic carboxypeptidase-like protein
MNSFSLISFWCALCQEPEDQDYYGKFLSLPEVRLAIHVGNQTFNDGSEVEKYLREDTVQSVKPWLTEIMNNYRVSKAP